MPSRELGKAFLFQNGSSTRVPRGKWAELEQHVESELTEDHQRGQVHVSTRTTNVGLQLRSLGRAPTVASKQILEPFLPVAGDRDQAQWRARAFYGNFGMHVRARAYIMAKGPDGVRQ